MSFKKYSLLLTQIELDFRYLKRNSKNSTRYF